MSLDLARAIEFSDEDRLTQRGQGREQTQD
jgi:hypothetical protein